MTDKEFVQKFKLITIRNVCRKTGVNYYNIIHGSSGYSATKIVVDEIIKEVMEIINQREEFKKSKLMSIETEKDQ